MNQNDILATDVKQLTEMSKRLDVDSIYFSSNGIIDSSFSPKDGTFVTVESLSSLRLPKRTQVFFDFIGLLKKVQNICGLLSVGIEKLDEKRVRLYPIFERDFRENEEEFYSAIFDFKLDKRNYHIDVLPMNKEELDTFSLSSDIEFFERKKQYERKTST